MRLQSQDSMLDLLQAHCEYDEAMAEAEAEAEWEDEADMAAAQEEDDFADAEDDEPLHAEEAADAEMPADAEVAGWAAFNAVVAQHAAGDGASEGAVSAEAAAPDVEAANTAVGPAAAAADAAVAAAGSPSQAAERQLPGGRLTCAHGNPAGMCHSCRYDVGFYMDTSLVATRVAPLPSVLLEDWSDASDGCASDQHVFVQPGGNT